MPKSYKLLGDGNYIDSTGIAHNKVALNTVITDLQNADISAIDNLTSTDTKNALSAAQGKILAEQIQNKAIVMIYNTDSDSDIIAKLNGVKTNIDGEGWIEIKSMVFIQSQKDENIWLPLLKAQYIDPTEEYKYTFFGFVNGTYVTENIIIESNTVTKNTTDSGVLVHSVQNNLTTNDSSTNKVLHANQGKILNDKITALEARIAALEAGEIELATDPDDTDEMNVWIQTS